MYYILLFLFLFLQNFLPLEFIISLFFLLLHLLRPALHHHLSLLLLLLQFDLTHQVLFLTMSRINLLPLLNLLYLRRLGLNQLLNALGFLNLTSEFVQILLKALYAILHRRAPSHHILRHHLEVLVLLERVEDSL